jgi:hypothetical protein
MSTVPIRIHTWSSVGGVNAIPEVMPMVRPFLNNSNQTPQHYANQAYTQIAARVAAKAVFNLPYEDYTLFPQNFGNRGNICSPRLFDNVLDQYPDLDNQSLKVPFYANGIAAARTWTYTFANTLRPLLINNGLPLPTSLHFDYESGDEFAWSLPTTSGPNHPVGWFLVALADPRASTELIDGVRTLNEFVTTYWESVHGSPWALSNNSTAFYSQGTTGRNNGTRLIAAIVKATQSWALFKGFMEPMMEVFPTIQQTSNYESFSSNAYDARFHGRAKVWDARYGIPTYFTHESPVYYTMPPSGFDTTNSTRAQHLSLFDMSLTGNDPQDFSELTFRRCEYITNKLIQENKPSIPWLSHVGARWINSSGQWPSQTTSGGYTHVESREELSRMYTMVASKGLRQIWSFNAQTANITNAMTFETAACIQDFVNEAKRIQQPSLPNRQNLGPRIASLNLKSRIRVV